MPLADHHDRERFSCGEPALDGYLQRFARKQNENNTTRLHVYASDEGEIAGYYTLSALSLELTGLPIKLQRGRPQLPVPATLLGRLARDVRYARAGVGPFLLSHAMRNAHEASRNVASAFLVIDAKPNALEWYLRQAEFEALPSNPLRLVLPISAIGELLR